MRRRPVRTLLAVVGLLGALVVAPARAHPEHGEGTVHEDDGAVSSGKDVHENHQHGGVEGHLPAGSSNVRLVGKGAIDQSMKDGRVADVEVFGTTAYLGGFWEPDCQRGGVHVMDVTDIANPKHKAFIPTSADTYVGEGVQVIRIDTPRFTGDVLGFNNEICDDGTGNDVTPNGGLSLVDVTSSGSPRFLAQHVGDTDASGYTHQIHSVFMWDAGTKAYAAIVDDEEAEDLDIVDITDPREPSLVAEYDLEATFPQIVQHEGGLDSVFLHDMVVKNVKGRWLMIASYWDGGYVVLDVTDPARATYVGDSDFTLPDPEAAESGLTVDPEGNGHYAEFTRDNGFIVAADEDFDPYKASARNVDDGTTFTAIPGDDTPGVPVGGRIAGSTVYVGLACGSGVPAATAPGQIAVVERGVCTFQQKLDTVVAAGGYQAAVVFNREGAPDGCDTLITMLASSTLPSFFVNREAGLALFDLPYDQASCVAGDGTKTAGVPIGTVGDSIDMSSTFDGWGYVHLYANGAGKLKELDTFAIPEAHDPAHASGSGDMSVHEVAASEIDDRLIYSSYYAGGFRVLRITGKGANTRLVETGHFIDEGGNNLWGVEVFQRNGKEYVAASDRDFGLYIFEYTGP